EQGHAFLGNFGYMGWNLPGVSDLLIDVARKDRTINIIWKDSDLSFKAIENTVPEGYQSISSDIVVELKEHCNVILE
ncbi:hypothetical protein SASC598P14_004440, partial [Snodgrassella alvi SCGC AB-598-P14]